MRVFVIAMPCEAAVVRPHLRADDRLIISGIGKVNAAAATQRAICEYQPDGIVNCGLCGGLAADIRCCTVYGVSSAVEYDFDLALVNGTDVGVKDERRTPFIPVFSGGGFPMRILATGDRFNDNEGDFNLFGRLGCALRDMEGAAIADICDKAHVPLTMFKSVADVHGQGSMTGQYKTNLNDALAALERGVCTFISQN